MIGNRGRVVVGDGQAALNVNKVADERCVKNKRLRAHIGAGHAVCEGGNFRGGEGGVPDADFGYSPIHILRVATLIKHGSNSEGSSRCGEVFSSCVGVGVAAVQIHGSGGI